MSDRFDSELNYWIDYVFDAPDPWEALEDVPEEYADLVGLELELWESEQEEDE